MRFGRIVSSQAASRIDTPNGYQTPTMRNENAYEKHKIESFENTTTQKVRIGSQNSGPVPTKKLGLSRPASLAQSLSLTGIMHLGGTDSRPIRPTHDHWHGLLVRPSNEKRAKVKQPPDSFNAHHTNHVIAIPLLRRTFGWPQPCGGGRDA